MQPFFRPWFPMVAMLGILVFAKAGHAQSDKEITNSIGMKLVLIPHGTFMMGSPPGEQGADPDENQHEVTISTDYYMGVTEVTQAQYIIVMGEKNNPSDFPTGFFYPYAEEIDIRNLPVETVTWQDAIEFCNRLTAQEEERHAGRDYRLPTEAEWEYACRAGSTSAFCFGDDRTTLADYAWYSANCGTMPHAVGQKKPNAWGLYDMHGNVWEWCSDWYGNYPKSGVADPTGPEVGTFRVRRGGCWGFGYALCRSANRLGTAPSDGFKNKFSNLGFRVVMRLHTSPSSPEARKP